MKSLLMLLTAASLTSSVQPMEVSLKTDIRPSATPLVTVDPYLSIWSNTDHLNEGPTTHWTGREDPLISFVRVDGQTYRLLGVEQPRFQSVLNTIDEGPWVAKCVFDQKPQGDWTALSYDDKSWKTVQGALGSKDRQMVKTIWEGNDRDVWMRREFTLEQGLEKARNIVLEYSHDDAFELYVNGIKVVDTGVKWKDDVRLTLPKEVVETLHKGKNVIACHCHNTTGGSYVDFGLRKQLPNIISAKAASQKSLSVLPTRTIYGFNCGSVDVDLIFTAPMIMTDLELMSRPVNYLTWQIRSNDGKQHEVQVYFAASPELAVNSQHEAIEACTGSIDGISFVRAGTQEQKILGKKGDNVKINWGYAYVATPEGKGATALCGYAKSLTRFAEEGILAPGKPQHKRPNLSEMPITLSYARNLGKVGSETVADYVMIGYDDIYSVQSFGDNLRPYWNRDGSMTITGQFAKAAAEYQALMKKCIDTDEMIMSDALKAGGKKYAELCALAYRQVMAAHKLVQAPDGEPYYFSKENFSNGSIGTVDITYPTAPIFLCYNPTLAKATMNFIFKYSESGQWTKPFAAHDVGTYPIANGQTYPGDMPVEESGNMIILTAAIAKIEGNAEYAAKHWETLSTWTSYLLENGLDPENQLCTDDFAGHFAHNANLSIKAIMGIASYAYLADMLGRQDVAKEYMAKAREMASKWKEMAFDGDHYRLTFDKSGTWSQKYNLVWDKVLGFNIFDPSIAQTEIKYYLGKQNEYGLPLDNRKTYTKTDWIMWSAAMADDLDDFEALIEPIYRFQCETEDRVPMSDWPFTDSRHHRGFQARSVVGGYYMKILSNKLSNH